DDQLGAISCPKSTLAVGESMTCTANGTAVAGQYANVGSVTGSPPVGDPVTDSDPSHYFGTGDPSISIVKEISVDGGNTWHDANDIGNALVAVFPSGAQYRFTVTNDGSAPLKDVVVNDPELGIANYAIGDLAVAQVVVLTSGDIPALSVETRCDARGTFINTATASGASAETDDPVSDNDNAVLKCIGEPHITIVKEISPTGPNGPWYDDATPPQEPPSDAWYRLTVTNDGTAPLVDVDVQDGDLGVLETIGSMAVGEVVVLTSAQVPELYVQDRCTGAGEIGNLGEVSATSGDDPNDSVGDSDTATLVCVGTPMIQVIKEISIDNVNWSDANTIGEALVTQAPSDAWYRITVRNTGPVDLVNVVLNDGTLGIFNYPIGNIAVGNEVILTSGELAALYYPGRCTNRGDYGNTATAEGESSETGTQSSDSDEAWLQCTGTPAIQIIKEISVAGAAGPWFDDTSPQVLPPADAWYRLTVTNVGTADLENVVVNDATLGIANFAIGDLPIGDSVILGQAEIAALYKQNRCTTSGLVVNTASASGDSLDFPFESVNDSDNATMDCQEEYDLCEVGGRPNQLKITYDADDDTDHDQGSSAVLTPSTVNFPPIVDVKIYSKNTNRAPLDTYTDVQVGDMMIVEDPSKSGKIPPTIVIQILDPDSGAVLQTITFHGSCSAPLNVGDEFGGITILGGVYF
ncbi:DUF7467 domain-containing protein, partial [Elongatibacter sediminis]